MIIYGVRLGSRLDEDILQSTIDCCPPVEQEKILSYCRREDRQRSLLGVRLLDEALKREGQEGVNLLQRNSFGRPFLTHSSTWQGDFNLSHSGNWIVLAIVRMGKIGIDVEHMQPINRTLALECLAPYERHYLVNQQNWMPEFYRIWTTKEAYLKSGVSGHTPLETIDTLAPTFSMECTHTFYPDPKHAAAVWHDGNHKAYTWIEVDRKLLLKP